MCIRDSPCWVDSGVESIKEEDAIESESVQKPVVCFDLERDIYTNLPPDEYELVAPYRTGPYVCLGGTMVQVLTSGPMVKMMFDSNYLLHVLHTNGRRSIPYLHQVPIVNHDRNSVLTLPVPRVLQTEQHMYGCWIESDRTLSPNSLCEGKDR